MKGPAGREPNRVVAFESAIAAGASASSEGSSAASLRAENARLGIILRHLQKDVAVKDAYLSALRAEVLEKDLEAAALRHEISRLHESIAQTMKQPRYLAADVVNGMLRRMTLVHRFLKWCLVNSRV